MPRYRVMADDNFRYQDENERYGQGTYDTAGAVSRLDLCQGAEQSDLRGGPVLQAYP
jgi:hypothetical protein